MLRFPVRALPVLALTALAACNGESTSSDDRFVPNRVVFRVEQDGSREELKVDAPLFALHAVSALDPARATTLALGGDPMEFDGASPMLQLVLPGTLAARSYAVGAPDAATAGRETASGVVVVPGRDTDAVNLFSSTGGTVEVVSADLGSGSVPGHLRARVAMDLTGFELRDEKPGGTIRATGRGMLDGPVLRALASDAEISFTGAFTGAVRRDLLSGVADRLFGATNDWFFLVGSQGEEMGALDIHLARIPAAGETIRFAAIPPDVLRGSAGTAADSVNSALLAVFTAADVVRPSYLSTAGQLRVESASSEVVRGTLALTLTEFDPRTGQLGSRTVAASGRVAFALGDLPLSLSRSPALRARSNRGAPPLFPAPR